MDETASPSSLRPAAAERPLVELLRLAGPTVLQMASYTLMQFIDTYLLARLGTDEAGAAAASGLFAFAVMCFGIGVLQLVNTLVSQNYGRGDWRDCGQYLWQGVWFGLIWSVVMTPLIPGAAGMFRLMGHTPEWSHLEATYLRIVLLATLPKMISTSFGQFLLAINRPRVVFFAAFISVFVNAIVAYVVVLGKFGCPSFGIVGAGWAQNLGVVIEAAVLVIFALQPAIVEKFNSLDWRFCWAPFRALVRVGWPSGLQFVADVLAWSIFSSVVMARAGTAAMSANMFTFRFMSVSFMPALGIGTAITALVGRYIGMGRPDLAKRRAHLGFAVNAVYMLSCGVLLYYFRHELMRLFTREPDVLNIGAKLLIFAAVYQLADALYCSYSGALRGAGDTFVPAMATGILNWTMSVAMGYVIVTHWPQFGAFGPWTAATVYGLVLSTYIFIRFSRGRWQSIDLEHPHASDRVPKLAGQLASES